jgi:anti-sigma regulatory factor (Ser/Thr protein kinase)
LNVNLPYQFDASSIHDFVSQVIGDDFEPKASSIVFNLNTMSFIRPCGVAIFSNIIEWLSSRHIAVSFQLPPIYGHQNSPVKFLDDSLFFQRYLGRKLFDSSGPRSTTIPLMCIRYAESFDWLENHLLKWLSRRLNLSSPSLANIKVCFIEIFNNINDHSANNIGCVFAQHFPRENIVKIAISDFGVGIPYNVKKVLPHLSDQDAILKATEEGFTTKSLRVNAGAGLDILITNVVKNNKGWIQIYSNCGSLSCVLFDDTIVKKPHICGYYPGTLIYANLRTDTIEKIDDDSEDFEW